MLSRQLTLDLGEMPASPLLRWDLVPVEHQRAALATLARLIAQAAVREEMPSDASIPTDPVA